MLLTNHTDGFFYAEGSKDQEISFPFYKTGKLGGEKIGFSHFIERESCKALILSKL